MNKPRLYFRSLGPAMRGVSVVCMLAAVFLTGCTSTTQSIKEVDSKFRTVERQAREDMLAGRHTSADANYARAAAQIDQTAETYVDGYFYLDHARMAGNRAIMALLDGNDLRAREYFSSSENYLTSGVWAHKKVLREREDSQQDVAGLLAFGAMVGVVALGIDASSDTTSLDQSKAVWNATTNLLELTVDAFDLVSNTIAEIHEIDVHEDAQYVDPDAWRAAVISDHPISQAVVRVFSGELGGTSSCTGFFIQPRLIATSAHCLNEHDKGDLWVEIPKPREEKGYFLLGKSAKRLNIERVHWPSTYEWNNTCHPDDVALIEVSEDNPSDHWLPIDTQPIVEGSKALVIGYSGDLDSGFFQRIDYGCEIARDLKKGMIGSNCASYPGNSGGPLFSVDYNRARNPLSVVGISSCGRRDYQGERSPGITKWAAGTNPLERLYRGIIAKQRSLGDPQLFQ